MNGEYNYIYDFINEIFVVCPMCESKSMVKSNKENRRDTQFICTSCGLSKKWEGEISAYEFGTDLLNSKGILIGQPVDCYFKYPLWYKKEIRGKVLFAYNLEHLSFLEAYISSKMRRRLKINGHWRNSSLQSRLPKWMVLSKNRYLVLKVIKEIKEK